MPRWLALESNPAVLNSYIHSMGCGEKAEGKTPDDLKLQFCDVFGTDDDLLAMVPDPARAMVVLFPITEATAQAERAEEEARKDTQGEGHKLHQESMAAVKHGHTDVDVDSAKAEDHLWFTHQTIGNACGTVAVMHVLMNLRDEIGGFREDSPLASFYAKTRNQDPAARGKALEEADEVAETHEAVAQEGQTETPELSARVNLHFVALIHHKGRLYEMDGRRDAPIDRGSTTPETFLKDAGAVVRDVFIKRDPTNNNFSLMALAPKAEW